MHKMHDINALIFVLPELISIYEFNTSHVVMQCLHMTHFIKRALLVKKVSDYHSLFTSFPHIFHQVFHEVEQSSQLNIK